MLRYIERNPLRAGLVERAEDWRWGSLYRRMFGTPEEQALLAESPVRLGRTWCEHVNRPQNEAEEAAIRRSIAAANPSAATTGQKSHRANWTSNTLPPPRPTEKEQQRNQEQCHSRK